MLDNQGYLGVDLLELLLLINSIRMAILICNWTVFHQALEGKELIIWYCIGCKRKEDQDHYKDQAPDHKKDQQAQVHLSNKKVIILHIH